MLIVEDTRNQVGKHRKINAELVRMGHKVVRSKMLVGDYMIANQGSVAIDTKHNVLELIDNVMRDHARFKGECSLAQEAEITLVVLIEEILPDGKLTNWQSPLWRSTTDKHRAGQPVTRARMDVLRKCMATMTSRYGVQFRFCSPHSTANKIMEILTGDANEPLCARNQGKGADAQSSGGLRAERQPAGLGVLPVSPGE